MVNDRTIFVVEDDPPVLKSMCRLLQSAGFRSKGYRSAEEFLDDYDPEQPGCLILDVYLDGMNGLDLQERMKQREMRLPVVFVSAYAQVPMVVDAMKAGAMGFLEKPFHDQELIELIRSGLSRDEQNRRLRKKQQTIQKRQEQLTVRELEVMQQCLQGKNTKQIAQSLGISPKTVDKHKSKMLQKMEVENPVELARLVLGDL